jgi:hypothetical protein
MGFERLAVSLLGSGGKENCKAVEKADRCAPNPNNKIAKFVVAYMLSSTKK